MTLKISFFAREDQGGNGMVIFGRIKPCVAGNVLTNYPIETPKGVVTMNEIVAPHPIEIEQHIFLIRGMRVMLSIDLADIYAVEPRVLVQAVKRNIERFPHDFMFQLSDQEFSNLKSQFVISSWGGRRANPYAFTEQGVAMLSGILNSPQAIRANIEIMRAFVRLRSFLASNKDLAKKLEELEQKYDSQFKMVFDAIRQLMTPPEPKKKRAIGFGRKEGQ